MRFRHLAPLAGALLLLLLPNYGRAAAWPTRPVTLVIPFSPGDESDALQSLIRPYFQKATRQEILFRHQPGRGGADAWALMDAKQKDGYTLTEIELPHLFLRSWQTDSGVNAKRMTVCVLLSYTPAVLWVPEKSPFASLEDFIDAAHQRPGALLVAGAGSYSTSQLAAKSLDRLAGMRTTYVPYTGTLEAGKAAQEGAVAAFWGNSMPWPESIGRFRALAVADAERAATLPKVPTFGERSYGLLQGTHRALAVPRETPPAVVEAIHALFADIVKNPQLQKQALEQGHSILHLPLADIPSFLDTLATLYRGQAESFDLISPAASIP